MADCMSYKKLRKFQRHLRFPNHCAKGGTQNFYINLMMELHNADLIKANKTL